MACLSRRAVPAHAAVRREVPLRPLPQRVTITSNTRMAFIRRMSAEGLIGFKLQGLVNDPRRTQDLEDIRALLRANRAILDMEQVREYFRLFERESLLDEIFRETS